MSEEPGASDPMPPPRPESAEQAAGAGVPAGHRCGQVAIVGRPNVGKSTLLNRLLGQKVSITSAKPQTTRHRSVGVLTRPDAQLLFLDTPGRQSKHGGALNRVLNRAVMQAAGDADVIVMVCDAARWTQADARIAAELPAGRPVVLAINKVDALADKSALLPHIAQASAARAFEAVVPISAERGTQLDALVAECVARLPEGPPAVDADTVTDRSERFYAAELLREKLFRLTGEEIPYTSTVVIDRYEEQPRLRRIYATILVEREAHRAIVLGAGGERIKRIASEARVELERMLDARIHLEVWVKIKSGWADNEQSLRAYGYE